MDVHIWGASVNRAGLQYRLLGADASSAKLTANLKPRDREYGGKSYAVSY